MASKPQEVRLVCGLGNAGAEYEHTRHNAGFACVDVLAQRYGVRYWKSEAGCMVARVQCKGADGSAREVLLAKSQDYMNTSGGPISKLMRQEHINPAQILVVHDEVDLPNGSIQVKWGGGLNAHNGLRSISSKLGTRDFARVRVGTGRPPGKMSVADYALRQLKGNYLQEFELEAQDSADAVQMCLEHGVPYAIGHVK